MGKWWLWQTLSFIHWIHKKIRTMLFPYLLANLLKQRCTKSIKSYEYLNKFISFEQVHKLSIKTMLYYEYYLYALKNLFINLKNLQKRKMHLRVYACTLPYKCWKSPNRIWMNWKLLHWKIFFPSCFEFDMKDSSGCNKEIESMGKTFPIIWTYYINIA